MRHHIDRLSLEPDMLEVFREELRMFLMTHPYARAFRRRLKPPPEVDRSGGKAVDAEDEPARKKKGGAA